MSHDRPIRLSSKIHIEVRVDAEASLYIVHINLEQVGAMLDHVWVELFVP